MADGGILKHERSTPAQRNYERLVYGLQRGHQEYCERALRLQDMYLGGGRQWLREDVQVLTEQKRKPIELNEIADAINTALGFQINNRVDIAYRPRGMGADDEKATSLSKVAMYICDTNDFPHKESDVFADGIIQERGYFELTLDFDRNMRGAITLSVLDPLDVIPDPDANAYDPDSWADVIITRWLKLDEIEAYYGRAMRKRVEGYIGSLTEDDIITPDGDTGTRDSFAGDSSNREDLHYMLTRDENGAVRVRVIDRQYWKLTSAKIAVMPTGDIRVVEDATRGQINQILRNGGMLLNRPMRRVRWTISTINDIVLHDDWSPFKHFTVIPYYPFFRRGHTRGLVNNMVGPQEMLNKAVSQFLHIINTMANSGWIVEQNSLTNMSTDDLEEEGAKTGLVVEYAQGRNKPEKIQPNQVPTGIDRLVELASSKIRVVSGISDALRGEAKANQSGVAVQSLQFGSQLSLAVPLDNLGRTRRMLAMRLLEMIQSHMTDPQILRITERDLDGNERSVEMPINWEQEDGSILNDLTIGEYDAVVTEQPSQITFQNSQFQQCLELKKLVPNFPDHVLIRYSNLADKNEVIEQLKQAGVQQPNPVDEARAALALAQATAKNVEALFSAIRTGQALRADPALAGVADAIARSAGFKDQDAAPIYPADVAARLPPGPPPPLSTNPLTPDNPNVGADAGMTAVKEGAAP